MDKKKKRKELFNFTEKILKKGLKYYFKHFKHIPFHNKTMEIKNRFHIHIYLRL